MAIPERPERGRIIWAKFVDTQGSETHAHPAVILTIKEEIRPGGLFAVAVASTQLHLSKTDDQIPLPWMSQPGGHPKTKLNKRCAVVCTWIRKIRQTDILEYAGFVSVEVLAAISTRVADLEKGE